MKPVEQLKATLQNTFAEELRGLADELQQAVDNAVREALDESGWLETCINCKHFDEPREWCTFQGANARPRHG